MSLEESVNDRRRPMTSGELIYNRQADSWQRKEAPDEQSGGTARERVTSGKILRVVMSLLPIILVIAIPLGGLQLLKNSAAASEVQKLAIQATATAYYLSLPTAVVPTAVPTFAMDYRNYMPSPVASSPMRGEGQPEAASAGATYSICVMRQPFHYDSGSRVSIVGCGDQYCSDSTGLTIPRQFLQCSENKYPSGSILLPTSTPLPAATPTPLIKWRQAACPTSSPCPVCPEVAPTSTPVILASDQIEICWRIDGIKAIWIDGQGVGGHECRVFGVPFEGGNEVEKWIGFKIQR